MVRRLMPQISALAADLAAHYGGKIYS